MTDEITLDAPETRLERFLAAAAGVDGITLDEPETRIERYLYKIAQGSGGVPAVEDADKGKYLHANESTGDLEWATAGGSGGGVLVVHEILHQGEPLVSGTLPNVDGYEYSSNQHGEGIIVITVNGIGDAIPLENVVVTIGTQTYSGNALYVSDNNTMGIKLSGEQQYPESAITGLAITVAESYTALDHTWQEIHDAGFSVLNMEGMCLLMMVTGFDVRDGYYVGYWIYDVDEYYGRNYHIDTADGYPVSTE